MTLSKSPSKFPSSSPSLSSSIGMMFSSCSNFLMKSRGSHPKIHYIDRIVKFTSLFLFCAYFSRISRFVRTVSFSFYLATKNLESITPVRICTFLRAFTYNMKKAPRLRKNMMNQRKMKMKTHICEPTGALRTSNLPKYNMNTSLME